MSRLRVPALIVLSMILLVALSPAAVQRPGCLPPPAGLTNWWPGDGTTEDLVGGLDAAFWNGPDSALYGQGLVGDAFAITGADDGNFVYVPADDALDFGTGDFTVGLWVRPNTNVGEQVLVEKWIQGSVETPGWTLTKLATNEVGFAPGGEDSGVLPILYADRYGERAWAHFAVRREGGRTTIFMNGRIISDTTGPAVDVDSASSLKFGHRGNPIDTPGSDDENNFFLNGLIDEVQLYVGRALPNGTIQAIYQAGSAGVCRPS